MKRYHLNIAEVYSHPDVVTVRSGGTEPGLYLAKVRREGKT